MLPKLYAITIGHDENYERLKAALRAGIKLVQLREKNLSRDEYTAHAILVVELCRKYGTKLIINDDIEVCAASGADGVHLGQSDGDPLSARKRLGDGAIIGVTAKTVEQAQTAAAAGADYLGCGAVFGSGTKRDAKRITIDALAEVVRSVSIPVYAIGGVTAENIKLLRGIGVYGAAVISGIFDGNIARNVTALNGEVKLL